MMHIFKETQRFDQWWVRLMNIGLLVFLLYCLYSWFIAKKPTGNVMPTSSAGQLVVIGSIIPVIMLFAFMKMEAIIDEIGIHYRFLPFHFSRKTIRWSDMDECHVRTYNPIGEYDGWGLRGSFGKNRAYNVKGNKGIQTVLKKGGKILIGTQNKNEANEIINRYFKTRQ